MSSHRVFADIACATQPDCNARDSDSCFTTLGYSPGHAAPPIHHRTRCAPRPRLPHRPVRRAPPLRRRCILPALPKPTLDPQLPRVRAALEAAELGQFDAGQYADIARHPLYGWVEYAALRRDIDNISAGAGAVVPVALPRPGRGRAVPRRMAGAAGAPRGLDLVPRRLGVRQIKGAALRCGELNARQATGRADAQWTSDAQAMWRSTGKSLPDECDAPMAALSAQGGLTPQLRWERIDLAADRMAARRDARGGARPARGRADAGQRLRRLPRHAARARPDLAEDRAQPRASPRKAWPNTARRSRPRPKRCCRATPMRSASAMRSAAARCTRSRCGRWPRTNRTRRGA